MAMHVCGVYLHNVCDDEEYEDEADEAVLELKPIPSSHSKVSLDRNSIFFSTRWIILFAWNLC